MTNGNNTRNTMRDRYLFQVTVVLFLLNLHALFLNQGFIPYCMLIDIVMLTMFGVYFALPGKPDPEELVERVSVRVVEDPKVRQLRKAA